MDVTEIQPRQAGIRSSASNTPAFYRKETYPLFSSIPVAWREKGQHIAQGKRRKVDSGGAVIDGLYADKNFIVILLKQLGMAYRRILSASAHMRASEHLNNIHH